MQITVEISFYPLTDLYKKPVTEFINEIAENKEIIIEPGTMSTLIIGEYDDVMKLIEQKLKNFMEKYPAVFSLKLSNSCKNCL